MTTSRSGSEGKPKLLIAAIALTAMTAAAIYTPASVQPEMPGVCFPAPTFHLDTRISALLGWLTILCCGIALVFLNKQYIFLKTNDTLYSSFFLMACGTQPALSARFGIGSLMLILAVGGLWLLLSQRGRTPSPVAVYLLFAATSAGSAIAWEFAVTGLLFIPCAYFFGLLDLRGLIAILLGVITPYWMLIAFGVIDAADFNAIPVIAPIWATEIYRQLFFSLLAYGITAIIALLCTLTGLLKIYSQNARLRASSYSFITLGVGAAIMVILNPTGSSSWGGMLNLCSAIMIAQLLSFNNGRGRNLVFYIALAIYTAIFIVNIYG